MPYNKYNDIKYCWQGFVEKIRGIIIKSLAKSFKKKSNKKIAIAGSFFDISNILISESYKNNTWTFRQ